MRKQLKPTLSVLMLAMLLAGSGFAQEEAGKAYREAYKLVLDQNWKAAAKALQEIPQKFPNSDWTDDALFWLCFTNEKIESALEKVFDCYDKFVQAHAKSEWVNDAKMNMVRISYELTKAGKPQYEDRVKSFRTNSDNDVQLAVLMALLEIGDENSLAAVISRLDRTPDEELRAKVVRMLGSHAKSPLAVNKLADLARKDPSMKIRSSAVSALGEIRSKEAAALLREIAASGDNVEIRKVALRRLGDRGGDRGPVDPDVLELLKKIALSDPNASVASAAVSGLRQIRGPEAVAALEVVYTESKSAEVRRAAIRGIAERRQDQASALPFLVKVASTDPDVETRRTAIYSLGELRSPEAREKLKEIAASAPEVQTREAAIRAIGDFRAEGGLDLLTTLLKSEKDARLKRTLIRVIGEVGKDSVVPQLEALAKSDPDTEVKLAAIRALREIRSEAAREALIRLSGSK